MRNLPEHDPVKWSTFIAYNKRDVETEMAIQQKLSKFPVPDFLWEEYHLDQEINDRGIQLDMELVEQAIAINECSRADLSAKMRQLTALENPNSVQQMKEWLTKHGLEVDSLDKKAVKELLKTAPPELTEVLELRRQLAKSSVKKYQAMQNAVCADGRARGMFQFYGANRSGRWAGRLIQLQNLPQNHMAHLEDSRNLVRSGDYALLSALYDSVPEVLSELIRTAFVPRDGYKFIVSDFSAIEARVLSFLAGESWRLKVFAENGDIYCASASAMFHVPVEKHGQNAHLRQKGKIAELALGYGGSVGALKSMGALEMGLAEEELQPLVDAWRTSNPNIVQLWWDVDNAVKTTVRQRLDTETHGIRFRYRSGMLFIILPSGRQLCYVKPKMGTNKFGGDSVTYEGVGSTKKWERIESYGPKFVENIVQAVSRDILMYAIRTLSHCFIVGHVHEGGGLIPLTAGLRKVLAPLTAVTFRAADQLAVFALDHAAAIPVFPFDFRPDRRHICPILFLGCVHHHHPALAVADAPPGDFLWLNTEIADDLVRYHHWDLILLVLFFTLIYRHSPGPPSTLSGRNEDS